MSTITLMEAAQRRYAPQGLFLLWRHVGSPTTAERFVDAVVGRWERLAFEIEAHHRPQSSRLAWSRRSPAFQRRTRSIRRGRPERSVRKKTPREHVVSGTVDINAWSDDQPDVSARGSGIGAEHPLVRSAPPARHRRQPTPGGGADASRDEAGNFDATPADPRVSYDESPAGEFRSREGTPLWESTAKAERAATSGSADAPFTTTQGQPPERHEWQVPDWRRGASTAPETTSGAAGRPAGASPGWSEPSSAWDLATEDDDLRRRIDSWYTVRRWREEAVEEWKRRGF